MLIGHCVMSHRKNRIGFLIWILSKNISRGNTQSEQLGTVLCRLIYVHLLFSLSWDIWLWYRTFSAIFVSRISDILELSRNISIQHDKMGIVLFRAIVVHFVLCYRIFDQCDVCFQYFRHLATVKKHKQRIHSTWTVGELFYVLSKYVI